MIGSVKVVLGTPKWPSASHSPGAAPPLLLPVLLLAPPLPVVLAVLWPPPLPVVAVLSPVPPPPRNRT